MAAAKEVQGYVHIERCIPGRGVRLDLGTSGGLYQGCICRDGKDCSSVVECSCMCNCAYDSDGGLKFNYMAAESRPIFECNSNCACSDSCPNRITQNPPSPSLFVVDAEPQEKGNGVACTHLITRGTFVGEYVGQIISRTDAKRRLDSSNPGEACYIVTFKEHLSSGTILTTNVDATSAGNITRFMNHSCSPNLVMVPVRTDSLLPRLCLFASRDIESGTELCFSYFGCRSVDLVDKTSIVLGKKPCLCGSKNCLGFLPLQN